MRVRVWSSPVNPFSNGGWRVTELAEANQHWAMVSGRARNQPHHADKLWCWPCKAMVPDFFRDGNWKVEMKKTGAPVACIPVLPQNVFVHGRHGAEAVRGSWSSGGQLWGSR